MYRLILFIVIFLLSESSIESAKTTCHKKHSSRQNFTLLARELGYAVNEYEVRTYDNYYLKLFNIPGKKQSVLLMHGFVDSADTFIIRGNESLVINLANEGYDVWIGNTRGNRYSRRHLYLSPDLDDEFWDYSFHDMAIYDLPAIIDFVLQKTGKSKLSAIGHSQGNTIFYVLGAMRPEYNDKINILVPLSPVSFLNNTNNAVSLMASIFPYSYNFLEVSGQQEVFGDNSPARFMYEQMCSCKRNYDVCARGIFFYIAGSDPEDVKPDFLPTIVEYYPTSTSRKNVQHTAQISSGKTFSQYDYGQLNLDLYNSTEPPKYELRNVRMPIALLISKNDGFSTVKDVEILRDSLPNVVEYHVMEQGKFNHMSAVWGKHMSKYLFPHIFRILEKYTD